MDTLAAPPRLPWLSIFATPRRTIRALVGADPARRVYLLSALAGIGALAGAMSAAGLTRDAKPTDFLPTLLVDGPILGIVLVLLASRMLSWSGQAVFSGRATEQEVRAAIAWVASVWIWIGALIFVRGWIDPTSPLRDPLGYGALALGVVAALALLRALAEVQQFSVWKSIASCLVAILGLVLALAIPVGCLWFVLRFV
jgi:hypothetical protein